MHDNPDQPGKQLQPPPPLLLLAGVLDATAPGDDGGGLNSVAPTEENPGGARPNAAAPPSVGTKVHLPFPEQCSTEHAAALALKVATNGPVLLPT